MSGDLLDLLGPEWASAEPARAVDERPSWWCSHRSERDNVTHGCPESGRVPSRWSDVGDAGYVDGMGRRVSCDYCPSCVGTGRTSLRDPWTDELLSWNGAPCLYCRGTGYLGHAWDCKSNGGTNNRPAGYCQPKTPPARVDVFGVTWDGRVFVAGEQVAA